MTDSTDSHTDSRPRTPWLLFAGALFGLGLATLGLLEERRERLSLEPDVAARVGERTIRTIDYQRVLAGVEDDLRSPVDSAMRRRVLDRMIDEELLVQRALELGLAVVDRRVRGDLTSGLIDSIVAEADAVTISEAEAKRHFENNKEFFTRPGRLRAQTLYFSARRDGEDERGTAARRVAMAADRLGRGDDPSRVEAELADRQVSPLPNAMLPASKVRDYVGPTMLERLQALETGLWSPPIETASGYTLARVIDREATIVPPFAEVADLATQDLKRRRGDEALRRYLDDLRGEIAVVVNEKVVETGGAEQTRSGE